MTQGSKRPGLTRDEKVENLIRNHILITMAIFEGVFTVMAASMAEALQGTAESLAKALDKGSGGVQKRVKQKEAAPAASAEVEAKTAKAFDKIRKEIEGESPFKDPSFKAFTKDPAFDRGIEIVEGHDLGVRPLTEKLSDADLGAYLALFQKQDKQLSALWAELAEWQKTTPKFGEKR